MSREQERARKKQLDAEVVDYINEKAKVLGETAKARKNDQVAALLAKDTLFLDQLQKALGQAFAGKLPVPALSKNKVKPKFKNGTKRYLNILISDTHFGSDLDAREVGHAYGPIEEARRVASVCRQVAHYKEQYRNETELNVHIIGDLINGTLHDAREGAAIAEQVARAMRILTQAIRYFSIAFKRGVTVYTAVGNHDRNTSRHKDRAVFQKHDSLATMIYYGVKLAVSNLPNVTMHLGYAPTYEATLFDKTMLGTHGDTVFKAPFPSASINLKQLDQQVCKINNARILEGNKPYNLVCVGHVHCASITNLPGGVIVVTNGATIPSDSYAQSIGIMSTCTGQQLFESVPGHIVGDSRFIEVTEKDDKDSSLDQIIQPYFGFDK